MIQKSNQRRKFHLQPKRGPRPYSLRETQRYFERFQRKPVTLPKLQFMEPKAPNEEAARGASSGYRGTCMLEVLSRG